MSFAAKTDYSGLARTGLEIVANEANASNQNLEIPGGTTGNILGSFQFGHVKNPQSSSRSPPISPSMEPA